mmetsp:Transcript_2490/g.3098  ORF Transcript_2490/g.3098 Transcript_2490/m.3098 type:complete len:259 (+) Transcript_2490:766-1542(+)
MPLERSRRAQVLFLILFVVIHFTQVFIIEPKLDVWYFMMTTTLIGLKFMMSFIFSSRHDPGFLKLTEEEVDETVVVDGLARDKFDMMHLLQVIPAENICPYCKVIKTPRSHHCHICNKCVDRFERHCVWTNNCVGRKNHTTFFIFMFYVWLDTFFLAWTSYASIHVTECELLPERECIYHNLCVGCNILFVHYLATIGDTLVCGYLFIPSNYWCLQQCRNYARGRTTYERLSKYWAFESNCRLPDSKSISSGDKVSDT